MGEGVGEPGFLLGGEEGAGEFCAEVDLIDFAAAGVGAVLRVAGDEEFAAGEGAVRMDGAGVVFEEGAGEVEREVVAIELGKLVWGARMVAVVDFFEEASAVKGGEIFFEAGADASGVVDGELGEQVGEGVGFGGSDGDHLVAAGVATLGAGDGGVVFGGAFLGDVDDGVGELLEDGEEKAARGLLFLFVPELGVGRSTAPSISAPSTWNLTWTRDGVFMGGFVENAGKSEL